MHGACGASARARRHDRAISRPVRSEEVEKAGVCVLLCSPRPLQAYSHLFHSFTAHPRSKTVSPLSGGIWGHLGSTMTSGSSRAAPTSQDKTRSTNRPKPAPKFKPRAPHARVSAKSALLGLLVLVVAAAVGVRCLLHSGDDGALPASHPTSPAPRTSASLQSLARRIEREAKQRPADPSIATETAGAFVAFGDVLKGTRWYVEALRRQVRLAGGTASQLEAVEGYGPLHLSLHLELHAIQLARQLLRTPAHARADYVRQIEARCSGPTPLTEQMVIALRSPLGVPRRLLAGALAHCAHSQSAMAELATKHNGAIRMQMGPNGLFHLLAHFGDVVLIHDAIAALPTKEVATQMQSRATLAQATPIQIAENRGHAAAAAALRTVMGDKGAAGDAGGGSVATDTGGGSDNTEGGSADTGGGWVRVTPPLQMSEAQRGALAEAEADHGGWGGSDTERRARPATADIKGGSQPSAAVSGGAGDAYLDDCEIDVLHLDSLSPAAFASVFYSRERPVLVRNGSAPHWGSLRSLLSVGELTRRYGEIGVRVSANPYHDDQEARKTSIAEFAAQVWHACTTQHTHARTHENAAWAREWGMGGKSAMHGKTHPHPTPPASPLPHALPPTHSPTHTRSHSLPLPQYISLNTSYRCN